MAAAQALLKTSRPTSPADQVDGGHDVRTLDQAGYDELGLPGFPAVPGLGVERIRESRIVAELLGVVTARWCEPIEGVGNSPVRSAKIAAPDHVIGEGLVVQPEPVTGRAGEGALDHPVQVRVTEHFVEAGQRDRIACLSQSGAENIDGQERSGAGCGQQVHYLIDQASRPVAGPTDKIVIEPLIRDPAMGGRGEIEHEPPAGGHGHQPVVIGAVHAPGSEIALGGLLRDVRHRHHGGPSDLRVGST